MEIGHSEARKMESSHILDKNTIHTQQGEYNRYLVQWEGLEAGDTMWIIEGDLVKLDLGKWKQFENNHL